MGHTPTGQFRPAIGSPTSITLSHSLSSASPWGGSGLCFHVRLAFRPGATEPSDVAPLGRTFRSIGADQPRRPPSNFHDDPDILQPNSTAPWVANFGGASGSEVVE